MEHEAFLVRERKKVGHITKRYCPSGYVAVTKPLARKLYESGIEITLCGNNVDSYHIFGGWHLGYTINCHEENKTDYNGVPVDFQTIIDSYASYNLGNELGRYAVFYVKKEEVK